ncbi:MAG: hypothetical protein GX472_10105 [Methanomicrobiales archaeon]|nr:hypothetical protein [Burkholderiaceae bacterium]NLH26707.1 hypothetical protein [Methanomicrobiales archaeon]
MDSIERRAGFCIENPFGTDSELGNAPQVPVFPGKGCLYQIPDTGAIPPFCLFSKVGAAVPGEKIDARTTPISITDKNLKKYFLSVICSPHYSPLLDYLDTGTYFVKYFL